MEERKGGMVGREEEGRDGKGNEGREGEGRGRQGKGVSERRERGREMGGDSSIWIFVHALPPEFLVTPLTCLFSSVNSPNWPHRLLCTMNFINHNATTEFGTGLYYCSLKPKSGSLHICSWPSARRSHDSIIT